MIIYFVGVGASSRAGWIAIMLTIPENAKIKYRVDSGDLLGSWNWSRNM